MIGGIKKSTVEKPKNLGYKPCLDAINEVLKSKSGTNINSIYNSKKVKEQLLELYNNKCAYCESKLNLATTSVRIDHYRPKDKAEDINKNTIEGHNGYYWLGYEWTNLLPTCEKCNGKKSNIFPLKQESKRIKEPQLLSDNTIDTSKQLLDSDFLKNENPLLLNPEIDSPENHFIFLPTGEIKPTLKHGADIEKSEATIKICGLNRDELIIARKRKIDNYCDKLSRYLGGYDLDKNQEILKSKVKDIFQEIVENTKVEAEYSRLHFFTAMKMDLFLFSQFDSTPKHKKLIMDLYSQFKKGKL